MTAAAAGPNALLQTAERHRLRGVTLVQDGGLGRGGPSGSGVQSTRTGAGTWVRRWPQAVTPTRELAGSSWLPTSLAGFTRVFPCGALT
jgi:hypothetical protein